MNKLFNEGFIIFVYLWILSSVQETLDMRIGILLTDIIQFNTFFYKDQLTGYEAGYKPENHSNRKLMQQGRRW